MHVISRARAGALVTARRRALVDVLLAGLVLGTAGSGGLAGCRRSSSGTADGGAAAVDAAPGIDAVAQVGCDPYAPRDAVPDIFIGPDGLEERLLDAIRGASTEVWVMMYLVTVDSFVDALVAAEQRGVDVRVLLDGEHQGNAGARDELERAGVPVRSAPSQFMHAHSKAFLIDGDTAIVMSSNLNRTAMSEERNYGVVDTDPEDVADLRAIFEADWTGEGYPDLACTRLVVSPVNARARVLAHINDARVAVDVAALYIPDTSVQGALIARHRAGVPVRVLLSDDFEFRDENTMTADRLTGEGIEVRFMRDFMLHAKLVIADGVPFIGSQNLSFTSLSANREVGVMVTAAQPAAVAQGQFESDWSRGIERRAPGTGLAR